MTYTLSQKYPLSLTQALVWNDMDALNHINNTVYFRYFEDVRVVMLEGLEVLPTPKCISLALL